ncbi:AsmA family protein, partial [Roseomonas terrae]
MRAVKWIGGLLGGLVLLLGIGLIGLTYALDAGVLTPRILAAIEASTGRTATLGRVSIGLGLTPRVVIRDATLANLPGGSRPDMARIRRAEASLAILPLLGGDIAFRQVAIEGADILLEQLPDGTPNWVFQAPPRDAAPAPAPAGVPPAERPERQLTIDAITLADSRVTLPDPRIGTVEVQTARVQGFGSGAESFTARFLLHGVTLSLIGEVPPAPAPIRATLATGGNRLAAQGRPGAGLAFEATLPDYAALRPLLVALAPQAPLPAVLPPLSGTLRLGADLLPLAATLQAGAADLAALRPGLRLTRLDVAAPGLDQPAEVTIAATQGELPITATLTLDRPGVLLPWMPEAPLGFRLRSAAGGAEAEATGRIERPRALEAATAELRVTVPDMQALAPILPDPVPLRDATVTARVIAEGPLRGPLRIEALRITADALAAEGEMRLTPGRPFGVDGRLAAERIDLDALTRRAPRASPDASPAPPAPAAPPAT